jgi:hypothetical protein
LKVPLPSAAATGEEPTGSAAAGAAEAAVSFGRLAFGDGIAVQVARVIECRLRRGRGVGSRLRRGEVAVDRGIGIDRLEALRGKRGAAAGRGERQRDAERVAAAIGGKANHHGRSPRPRASGPVRGEEESSAAEAAMNARQGESLLR